MAKTTVLYHSADFDGIFCREIARRFLNHDPDCDCLEVRPDAPPKPCNCIQYIGWDFGNPQIPFPYSGPVYVMDLPLDKPFNLSPSHWGPIMANETMACDPKRVVWIDHHKSSIETHPTSIPGYRIDGVAACRLAWQWFRFASNITNMPTLPSREDYLERKVYEPLAVRLAGEYDIWDHRGDGDLELQFGLRASALTPGAWGLLLTATFSGDEFTRSLIETGRAVMQYQRGQDARAMKGAFLKEWEGLKFLCLNAGGLNSNAFASKDLPETGHDALLAFYYNGRQWMISLYHAKHRTDLDLSLIAVKHGGGGHRGACGFQAKDLSFLL